MKFMITLMLLLSSCNYSVAVGATPADCNFTEFDGTECAYVETADGNGWVIEGTLEENAEYALLIDTKGTKSIYDDRIIGVQRMK